MAGQRTRMLMGATVNGYPVMSELEGFTPPDVKKVMEEVQGGRFVPGEIWVGLEKMNYELKIGGLIGALAKAYGLQQGEICQIDVKTSERDEDGKDYAVHYSLSGQLTGIKEDELKGKSKAGLATLSGTCTAYKKTENGTVLYDINVKTQVIDLGRGDVMASHRRNVGI
uniref:Putative tail tube protein n=1 Tax=viral metagenome TaxID=1070528 RepID=A0A6M3J602_9ZZZZ